MKTSLCKNLKTPEDKEEIKGQFIAALRLRTQLIEVIKDKIASADTSSITPEGYESPSWAYRQADLIGYKRGLFEIISLLEK